MDTIRREVYRRADVRNVLRALQSTNNSLISLIEGEEKMIYQAGFMAAILATATAFELEGEIGITPLEIARQRHLLPDSLFALLSPSSCAATLAERDSW